MKYYEALSFKNKIFWVFTITFFAIIFLSGITVFKVAMPAIQNSSIKYEHELVRQSSRRIDDYLSQLNTLCIQVSYSSFTRDILGKHYNGQIKNRVEYSEDCFYAFKQYQDFSKTAPGITGIFIYNSHGYPYFFSTKETVDSDLNSHNQSWFHLLATATDYSFIKFSNIHNPIHFRNSNDYNVSLIRNIRSLFNFKIIGQAEILINPNSFKKILYDIGLKNSSGLRHLTLVDANSRVIYSDKPQYNPGDIYEAEEYSYIRNSSSPSFQSSNNSVLTSSQYSDYSGWYLIGETDYAIVKKDSNRVLVLLFIFSLISSSLVIISAILISRRITKPIELMQKRVNELKNGDFDSSLIFNTNDEFSNLVNSFNEMSHKLKKNIERIYTVEEQKRKAEIAALQSQINPHFTLNTLNTIKYIATLQHSTNIVTMIEDFTRLIEAALKSPNELITIKDEINRIQAFMRIQEITYFNKIKMELDFDENVLDCKIMGLILQPIMENAIFHGIKPKLIIHQIHAGSVKITIRSKGSDLIIHVIDDGVGMSQEHADSLLRQMSSGIGVKNVNTRIKLRFGEQYGLSITSAIGKGCDVSIRLPQIRKE